MPRTYRKTSSQYRGRGRASQVFPFSRGTRTPYRAFGNPTVGRGKRVFSSKTLAGPAQACMQSCMNAFANETNQPRFPDGKAAESTGLRYMSNHEVEVGPNGDLDILLFPGLNTCLAIRNGRSKALGNYLSAENGVPLKLQGVNNNVLGTCTHDGNTLTFDQSNNSYVAKWRGVSYGFFLQTVNNADENDGWWEAIRISPSQDMKDYGFTFNTAEAGEQPLHVYHNMPEIGGDIVNQVSYSQGVIRDISKVLFQLNHEVGEREFVDMNKTLRVPSAGVITGTPTTANRPAIPLDALSLNSNPAQRAYRGMSLPVTQNVSSRLKDEAISQFIDQGFDCIYLKIHGVDNSSGRSPTRITCTCAMNLELMYDEKALNVRFHMPAVYHPMHEKIKGSVKAAEPNFLLSTAPGNSIGYGRSM